MLGGVVEPPAGRAYLVVERYTATAHLDRSFGSAGRRTFIAPGAGNPSGYSAFFLQHGPRQFRLITGLGDPNGQNFRLAVADL